MKISHRFQTAANQTKFFGRCQCTFWLSNGLAARGPLNSKPIAGEPVWAETPEQAKEILMAAGDYEWVEIYTEAHGERLIPPTIKSWELEKDDPDYCPF